MADPTTWQPFVPGNPFYTPQPHSFGGNWNLTLTHPPCTSTMTECVVDVGIWMPDSRNDQFVEEGVAGAFSVRMANDGVGWVDIDGVGGVNVIGKLTLVVG